MSVSQPSPSAGVKEELLRIFGKDFPKGTVLFNEGEVSDEMYIIHEGKIKVSKKVRSAEKTLAIMSKGEFFGEMAILNRKPRSATVEVTEDSKLLVVTSKTLKTLLQKDVRIGIRLLLKLSSRLQEADDLIENLMLKDDESKVANTLIKLANEIGVKVKDGVEIPIDPNHIVPKVGLDVERLKGVLAKFKKLELLRVSGKRIIIRELNMLQNFLRFMGWKEELLSRRRIYP
ncbi:MAG: Crp/Fnr family transcriptional regulator [Deltaproteobacteria bacterium]|nr:MAG: Crp/Fnr family transcriptional regulator [Deltaproteobacteria bacterium]